MRTWTWPGARASISALGWELGPHDLRNRNSLEILLRRSVDRGINLLAWGGAGGAVAERPLWESGVLADLDAYVVLARSIRDLPGTSLGLSGPDAWQASLESTLPLLRRSGRTVPQLWIEWDPVADGGENLAGVAQGLEGLVTRGTIQGWGAPLSAWARFASIADVPKFAFGTLSLLEQGARPGAVLGGTPFLARNVLAGGRLAGLGPSSGPSPERVPGGPLPIRTLAEEMAPALRFGFLAIRGRRTLGQAAIRWALDQPGVYAALVSIPPPERIEEFTGWEETPPLTIEEAHRVSDSSAVGRETPRASLD